MIDRTHELPITRQAAVLGLSRASVYYTPRAVPEADVAVMRRLDALHLELPFAGSRMLRDLLRDEGIAIGRDHVRTLMARMRITAIYRRPRTSQRHPAHAVFPYLLRSLVVDRPNQVWATDQHVSADGAWVCVSLRDHGLGHAKGVGLAHLDDPDHGLPYRRA
jgi:putative transposase